MEQFYSLLRVMGVTTDLTEEGSSKVDIVSSLPPEIAVKILRLLDTKSLVAAVRVNKHWFHLCQMDRVLRSRVLQRLRYVRHNIFDCLLKFKTSGHRDRTVYTRPLARVNEPSTSASIAIEGERQQQRSTSELQSSVGHVFPVVPQQQNISKSWYSSVGCAVPRLQKFKVGSKPTKPKKTKLASHMPATSVRQLRL
ncbi:uncharacterized protein [Anabrus simplex]|uniref:uncharacterized protein n=1 Tax=Anabrus simplex TaxID=316456 RepID=UPI0034DD5C37